MKSIAEDHAPGTLTVPSGKIAAAQTFLQMHAPPQKRPDPPGVQVTLRRVTPVDIDWYRALFHKVGDAYLWFSRLELNDEQLHALVNDPNEEIYAIELRDSAEGLLELNFRTTGECEIAYFALTPKLIGTGTGRWVMNRAIERAWTRPINRLWVHTCTLDDPGALEFYRRSGFVPFERKVEIIDDPRLTGLVPRDAAPQIPII